MDLIFTEVRRPHRAGARAWRRSPSRKHRASEKRRSGSQRIPVAESGRWLHGASESEDSAVRAKRPHSRGHWPGKKLKNVEEDLRKTSGRPPEDLRKTSGRPPEDLRKTSGRPPEDILPLAPRPKLHFGKIPKSFGQNLAKILITQQNSGKLLRFFSKNQQNISNF